MYPLLLDKTSKVTLEEHKCYERYYETYTHFGPLFDDSKECVMRGQEMIFEFHVLCFRIITT